MTTYIRTETAEAMQWTNLPRTDVIGQMSLQESAEDIVAWIKANDGEVRYGWPAPDLCIVGVRTAQSMGSGLVFASPGDWIVMGEWLCDCGPHHKATCDDYRAFTVVPAAEWSSQGWQPT